VANDLHPYITYNISGPAKKSAPVAHTAIQAQFSLYVSGNTELFEVIVGVLTTCHTQCTLDSSICIFYLVEKHSKFSLHN